MTDLEKNKAVATRWLLELWGEGDLTVADEIMSLDYVRHDQSNPITGPEEYKKLIKTYRSAISNLQVIMDFMVAEDDKVFILWTARGTVRKEVHGIRPTCNLAITEVRVMDLLRIVDGKIVESWPSYEVLDSKMQP